MTAFPYRCFLSNLNLLLLVWLSIAFVMNFVCLKNVPSFSSALIALAWPDKRFSQPPNNIKTIRVTVKAVAEAENRRPKINKMHKMFNYDPDEIV